MTPQEIFDKSVSTIINQGGASLKNGYGERRISTTCMYRSPTGRMCAAGVFLTDKEARGNEGYTVGTDEAKVAWSPFIQENLTQIKNLQEIHDNATYDATCDEEFLYEFRRESIKYADRKGLSTEVLKGIEMTPQEIFDATYRNIVAQGGPSYDESAGNCNYGTCMYRGPNDCKCAIGHFIDDETAESWELNSLPSIKDDLKYRPGIFEPVPDLIEQNWELFVALQDAHDTAAGCSFGGIEMFFKKFKAQMSNVAYSFDLNFESEKEL